MSRRPARNQKLPPMEVMFLKSLDYDHTVFRVQQLYQKGWTLAAIGSAFTPPKGRSSIKAWADRPTPPNVAIDVPIPDPNYKTPRNGYVRKTPVSPGITPGDSWDLEHYAPLARRYRSGMASTSPEAIANAKMDDLVRRLRDADVTIAEIARAAGVTHRAISRRLSK